MHACHGAAAARRLRPAGPGREAGAPLDLVQIDHTLADIVLVDATRREPIGRPWLTLVIDVATHMVAAAHVSLDPPSSLSVALALSQAVLPKAPHLARFGIEDSWPVQGLPRTLHCNNAKEFRAAALERGAVEHGVRLEFRPPARPTYGAHIERLVGTVSLAHAATAGGGSMPYSSWLTTFKASVSGEVAQMISLVVLVGGIAGWIIAGQLEGLLQIIMRCGVGIAIIVGATTFLTGLGTAGAVL